MMTSERFKVKVDGELMDGIYEARNLPQVGHFLSHDGKEYEVKRVVVPLLGGRTVLDCTNIVAAQPKAGMRVYGRKKGRDDDTKSDE